MDIVQLVKMANQIGTFFSAMPDRQQAQADIASHLQRFWEPRMRLRLLSFLEQHPDGCDNTLVLDDIVVAAVSQHRASLVPLASQQSG